jgi:hypothetical protein
MTCDSVSIQGMVYPRMTFTVHNLDPTYYIDQIVAIPLGSSNPADTCSAIGAAGPDQWLASADPRNNGAVLWTRGAETAPTLLPGQTLGGFQVVLTREHFCCYELHFEGIYPEPIAYENDCFECLVPTPTVKRSWGALKVRYR